jgi:hypothetical protein
MSPQFWNTTLPLASYAVTTVAGHPGLRLPAAARSVRGESMTSEPGQSLRS